MFVFLVVFHFFNYSGNLQLYVREYFILDDFLGIFRFFRIATVYNFASMRSSPPTFSWEFFKFVQNSYGVQP